MRLESFLFAKRIFTALLISTLLFSCIEGEDPAEETPIEEEQDVKSSSLFEVSGKVFSVPSPIQTAFLLKKTGLDYNSAMLAPTSKATTQNTSFEKALNLGIYGADLGYVTIYGQNQDAISYMAVTRRLATELNISNIFNEQMVSRFEQNLGKEDSLMAMVSDAFKSADQYLKENNQEDLSVMILAGGWIETLYFATHLAQETGNKEIINRIGEQKITIKNLIKLMVPYRSNETVGFILNQLNELKDLYNDITFTYTFKEPTTKPEIKTTIINSESSVNLSGEQLKTVTEKIKTIRDGILN